jgi:voltage-gated potassium channel
MPLDPGLCGAPLGLLLARTVSSTRSIDQRGVKYAVLPEHVNAKSMITTFHENPQRTRRTDGVIDERSEHVACCFERPLLVAAVLTIPVTILQLLPPPDPWRTIADVLNWLIWLMFLAEVVVMLVVVPSKRDWLRRHPLELAIVTLTPPFLVSIVQSARVLRLLRLLRFLRLAPLVRVLFSGEGISYAALLTMLTAVTGGASFASVEHISFGDGIYWAITTMTTVGYGDIAAHTAEGKAIAIAVMLTGIGFAALVIGASAERFVHHRAQGRELSEDDVLMQVRDISARLQRLERALQQPRTPV